jgi:glycosyltransferase involved in cell wall biosynthesis
MKGLSAIVITKNEVNNIAHCLESLHFVDEIVVVDSGSIDGTTDLARQYTEKVYTIEWRGYAATKQYALEKTTGEWILWLDADERVTAGLAKEIRSVIQNPRQHSGFQVPRRAYFLGRWIKHGGWYPGYVIRLFKKEAGHFGEEKVHERLHLTGQVGTLKGPIDHYTDNTIQHYFDKFNQYTSLAAEDLGEKEKRFHVLDLFIRPIHMFLKMYLWKTGFLDGIEGFLLAVFSAHYVFVKYAKLWELGRKA